MHILSSGDLLTCFSILRTIHCIISCIAGNYFTLQDAVKSILPEYFPKKSSTKEESSRDEDENEQTVPSEEGEKYLSENVDTCYPSDNVEIKLVRIQGIEPKMDIPFSWVVKNLTNPEHYLHICVCLKVPQVL